MILQIALYLVGLFAFVFLANAFLGKISSHQGKVKKKYIKNNQQGKPFYRVCIMVDSNMVELQSQPHDYEMIEVGDSVTYYVRKGLFNNAIIERYNAKIK